MQTVSNFLSICHRKNSVKMGKTFSQCISGPKNSTEKLDIKSAESNNGNANEVPLSELIVVPVHEERSSNGGAIPRISSKDQSYYDRLLAQTLQHQYKMNHKNRGTALIFNHETFNNPGLPKRTGTAVDSSNLKRMYQSLNFDVQIHNDLSLVEIKRTLREYAAKDHSEEDCVILTILSHGENVPFVDKKTGEESHTILAHEQLSYVHARDTKYPLQTVFKYLTDRNCPSLKDKPRLFFIQACQGDKLDTGYTLIEKPRQTERDNIGFEPLTMEPVLPHNDYLVAYSTLPGFYSFRNSRHGSWFIRELCKELNFNDGMHDILGMLTYVIQTVAYDYESQNNVEEDFDEKKQIPCVTSYLTKLLYFPKVINQDNESP